VIKFSLVKPDDRPLRVLCLGAHADDLEIGCGGTILHLVQDYAPVEFRWMVFSGYSGRADEARASMRELLAGSPDVNDHFMNYRDGYFPWLGAEIKDVFEQTKAEFDPDLIFTHYHGDFHQDHRVICDLTWNTFRNHLVLEYEVPKYDGDLGRPNFFIELSELNRKKKLDILLRCFSSQTSKQWFTEDLFEGLMRLRGIEANSRTGFAEAFYVRKAVG
jgi:LmbE family N-acetylglucosaminyl deacetylase